MSAYHIVIIEAKIYMIGDKSPMQRDAHMSHNDKNSHDLQKK